MELDQFTQKLIERSQARKELLNKKLNEVNQSSVRKRRTALIDENQLSEQDVDGNSKEQAEESPKRQCLEAPPQNTSETKKYDDKENAMSIGEEASYVPYIAPSTRGLAALKKIKSTENDDFGSENSKASCSAESKVISYNTASSNNTHSSNSHKSRLAALAADIRQWEDDVYSSSNSSKCISSDHSSITKFLSEPIKAKSNPATNDLKVHTTTNALTTFSRTNENTFLDSDEICNFGVVKAKSPKRVSFHPDCHDVDDDDGGGKFINVKSSDCMFSKSCTNSNPVKEANKFKTKLNRFGHQQEAQKVHVWDQAILTTLESQGFVKSPSSSKLHYEFSVKEKQKFDDGDNSDESNYSETNDVEMEDSSEKSTFIHKNLTKTSEQRTLPSTISNSSPSKGFAVESKSFQKEEKKSTHVLNLKPVPSETINQSTDPAQLPLSARKALFEKAFCGVVQKQADNVIEANMTVAQRAAMFEKASKITFKPPAQKFPKEPVRFIPSVVPPKPVAPSCEVPKSPIKIVKPSIVQESKFVKGNGSSGSPSKRPQTSVPSVELILSPSKNAGIHTRLVQQQLIENSANDWRNKEIAAKASEERKTEMSALLNHWEKVSSSSSLENSNVESNQGAQKLSSSPESEKYAAVFKEENYESENDCESEEEISCDEEMPDENLKYFPPEEKELSYSESEKEESDNDQHEDTQSLASDVVNVCNEMDEILNEALDTEEPQSLPDLPPPRTPAPKISKSSSSSGGSASSSGYRPSPKPHFSTPVAEKTNQVPTHVLDNESEVPLLHTVSFYRKQKQETRTTPVRTIVRKPQVVSPPSPEVDRTEAIQQRIRVLQEDVLAQQTVISQTSQALNLCHATEEFFGSTEQVEGERLLLIATQKRQACLNEIQRLKTHGAHGKGVLDGTGTLIMNDIRLPLKRDFIASQLEGKDNDIVHYFLCLIRHGAQVIVTQMLSTADGVSNGSMRFTNHITLRNLPADFSVAFEVYALQTKKEVMPHDKKYHIKKEHSKIRLTPKGKRLESKLLTPGISSPGGPNAVRTPSFAVVGFTRFTLQNCERKSCTLDKVPFSSPLEGVLELKMQLHAEHKIVERGFLTTFEDVSGFGAWHRRWCVLDGSNLAFWKYPDDEKKKDPLGVIDLRQCVTGQVRLVSRDICARRHTFQLVIVRPQEKGDKNTLISRSVNTLTTTKHLYSADTKEERILWCNRLNEALTNVRKWDPQALRPIEVKQ